MVVKTAGRLGRVVWLIRLAIGHHNEDVGHLVSVPSCRGETVRFHVLQGEVRTRAAGMVAGYQVDKVINTTLMINNGDNGDNDNDDDDKSSS